MKLTAKAVLGFLKDIFAEWSKDQAWLYAAALSYYTVFSLAPILIIALAVVGFFFDRSAATGEITSQIRSLAGDEAAQFAGQVIAQIGDPKQGITATIIAIFTIMLGASGVFFQLKNALDRVWGVEPRKDKAILNIVKARLVSFGFALATGFLLLVSLVISAGLAAVTRYFSEFLPGAGFLWQAINVVVSLTVITFLFGMIFKIIPDAIIRWRDVWVGAFVTSVLFNIGKYLIGVYLGQATIGSAYGAAGSLVVFLVWIYYSAQILFLGAEFTNVYARKLGHRIQSINEVVERRDDG